ELGDAPAEPFRSYVRLTGLFKRGELTRLCLDGLEAHGGEACTREIAAHIIAAKGLDATDRALAISVGHGVVTTLGERYRRRLVGKAGKRQGTVLGRLEPGVERGGV